MKNLILINLQNLFKIIQKINYLLMKSNLISITEVLNKIMEISIYKLIVINNQKKLQIILV